MLHFCNYIHHTRHHAPRRPHNKANLCCTTLQVAGCDEPHMPGLNPFYLAPKIFLLTTEEKIDIKNEKATSKSKKCADVGCPRRVKFGARVDDFLGILSMNLGGVYDERRTKHPFTQQSASSMSSSSNSSSAGT